MGSRSKYGATPLSSSTRVQPRLHTSQAVVGLVYCKREGRQCAPHLQALKDELTGTFPGLRVIAKPMTRVNPGEHLR